MDVRANRGQEIFFFARACGHAFERLQKSSVIAMIFAVSCFAAADQAKTTNPKIDNARLAVVNQTTTAQADIRRDLSSESDPNVRAKLISILGNTRMDQDSLTAVRSSLVDSDPAVRAEAVIALGQSKDKSASSDLQHMLLNDPSEGVRMSAAFWLGALKDPEAVPALAKALANDSDPHVRAQAAHSLKWVGTTASKAELRKARNDKDARVRKIANGF